MFPTFPGFETKLVKLKTSQLDIRFHFMTFHERWMLFYSCSLYNVERDTLFTDQTAQTIYFLPAAAPVLQTRNPVKIVMPLHSFVPHTHNKYYKRSCTVLLHSANHTTYSLLNPTVK